jgi:hypothetical protein
MAVPSRNQNAGESGSSASNTVGFAPQQDELWTALLPLALKHYRFNSEHLLINPPQQRVVELDQLLSRDVRHDWPPLALDHQIPHRGNRLDSTTFVRDLRVVRDEMELSTAVAQAALLDFMAAHKMTRWVIDAVI